MRLVFKDILFYKCPFCSNADITVTKFLGATSVKRKRTATFGSAVVKRRSPDTYVVSTKSCPACGKSGEEIQRKLEEENMLG